MDFLWNIWDFTIKYLFWALFLIIIMYKFYNYYQIKRELKFYSTLPEIPSLSRTKKIIILVLILLAFFVLIMFILKGKSIFIILPFLIVAGDIYINAKLSGTYLISQESIFFYDDNYLFIYPIYKLFFKRFEKIAWSEIQKINFINKSGKIYELEILLNSEKKINKIIIYKYNLHSYLKLFEKNKIITFGL